MRENANTITGLAPIFQEGMITYETFNIMLPTKEQLSNYKVFKTNEYTSLYSLFIMSVYLIRKNK